MKTKLFISILSIGMLLNSCKKKVDFESIDSNLIGRWQSSYISSGYGASVEFSTNSYMEYKDKDDGSSREDDVSVSGTAKYKNGIIFLGHGKYISKFKIEEYPIPFDTTVWDGSQYILTHWRMKMKRSSHLFAGNINWVTLYALTFYKE